MRKAVLALLSLLILLSSCERKAEIPVYLRIDDFDVQTDFASQGTASHRITTVWIQVNGPILWPWAKSYRFLLMLLGVPITWAFMEATRFAVQGFGGQFWPGRFMSFVAGIFVFTIMTYLFRNEAINLKTAVSLCLALSLILVQLFWKS